MTNSERRTKATTVRLDPGDHQRLRLYASVLGTSVNAVVARAVRLFLTRHATDEAITELVGHTRARRPTAR